MGWGLVKLLCCALFTTNHTIFFQMVSAPGRTFELISGHPMFHANKNLWYNTYPNETHSIVSWLKRIWNTFKILPFN